MRTAVLAAFAFAASLTPAFAQPAENDASDDVEIIVQAPRSSEELVRSFVQELSAPAPHAQMPVWDGSICPGVVGMRARYAQVMIDRMAETAYRIGLTVGEPGCTPNILIYFTRESDALAQEIVQQRRLVSDRNQAGQTRGRDALRDFATTPRPIRWWHVSRTRTNDGFDVDQGETTTVRSAGRIRANTRLDLDRVLIVIDADDIDGVRFGAMADYVTMAALAQLNPDADVSGLPSILNLFNDDPEERPATLTEWDYSYLEGLYAATRDARSSTQQQREITRSMTDEALPRN